MRENVKRKRYVLDSFAVLAYLQAERGGAKVKDLLKEAKARDAQIFLSVINLGEIICVIERKLSYETAMKTFKNVLRLPIQLAEATLEGFSPLPISRLSTPLPMRMPFPLPHKSLEPL